MKYHIQVTQAHINRGIPGHPCKCPIALAAGEQLPLNPDLDVGPVSLTIYAASPTVTAHELVAVLPVIARRFIKNFDRLLGVEPIEFDIELEVMP